MKRFRLGLRRADAPFAPKFRGVGIPPSGHADLSSFAGEIVDQNHVGHCTTAVAKAAVCSLRAAGVSMPEPSHVVAYQLALRLDRAEDYPGVPTRNLPPLRDCGSTLATMVRVLERYGLAPKRGNVSVDGWERTSDCGPANATDERSVNAADAILASQKIVLGPYEIDYASRERDVQLALDAGYACADGGWVDLDYMYRDPSSPPAGAPDITDPDGGGHAQMIIGYRTDHNGETIYLVQNSWGAFWGDGGRTWATRDYLMSRWNIYAIKAELQA